MSIPSGTKFYRGTCPILRFEFPNEPDEEGLENLEAQTLDIGDIW